MSATLLKVDSDTVCPLQVLLRAFTKRILQDDTVGKVSLRFPYRTALPTILVGAERVARFDIHSEQNLALVYGYLLIRHPNRMPPSPQEKAFLYLLFRLRIVWSVVQFCIQYQEAFLTLLFERYLCTEPSPGEKVSAMPTDEEIQNNTARQTHPVSS